MSQFYRKCPYSISRVVVKDILGDVFLCIDDSVNS